MDADDQSRTDKSAENNGNVDYKRLLGEIRGFRPVKSNDGLAKGLLINIQLMNSRNEINKLQGC